MKKIVVSYNSGRKANVHEVEVTCWTSVWVGHVTALPDQLVDAHAANIRMAIQMVDGKLCQTSYWVWWTNFDVTAAVAGRHVQTELEKIVVDLVADTATGSNEKECSAETTVVHEVVWQFQTRALDTNMLYLVHEVSLADVLVQYICVPAKAQDGRDCPRSHRATFHVCGWLCSCVLEDASCEAEGSVLCGHWETASMGTYSSLHGLDWEILSPESTRVAYVAEGAWWTWSGLSELGTTMEDPAWESVVSLKARLYPYSLSQSGSDMASVWTNCYHMVVEHSEKRETSCWVHNYFVTIMDATAGPFGEMEVEPVVIRVPVWQVGPP